VREETDSGNPSREEEEKEEGEREGKEKWKG
jgi:hypothetical protein